MKIRLNFDDIIYQLQKQGGISKYWQELTNRIATNDLFEINHTTSSKITRYLPVYTNADIFHSSYYRKPSSIRTINVVTVYDFLYHFGYLKNINTRVNIWQMKSAINAADAIVCISENTKRDLFLLYPHLVNHPNIYVVSIGTYINFNKNLNLKPPGRLLELSISKLKKSILFVGKRIKYKNFDNALLGFYESELAKDGFTLLCVGSSFSETELQLLTRLDLQNNVAFIENASETELNYLYQNAFALVYPSLYEGFGLPPLEAMSCGCPVIASNTSSIPEVVADAGILINPYDPHEIASSLRRLLHDETRNSYITKGFARAKLFNWDKVAQNYVEIYKALVSDSKN
ncbi:MAG: glycosyltransferase family 1 protein [Aulosira sp. DedQUE10]|nr:glycosyltransferase family 1 protein [Aulosira sp. DedQUE10]